MNSATRGAKWILWVVVGVVLLVGSVVGANYLGLLGPGVQVRELVADSGVNPIDATEELCAEGRLTCVEAWRTDVGDYLQFDSRGAAEEWETILGDDGRRWNSVVLDMHDHELTFEQRRLAIEILFSYHDWG